MNIISRFERIDAAIARALPQWPVSLCILVSLGVGLVLAALLNWLLL